MKVIIRTFMHRTANNYLHKGYIASFFLRVKRMDKMTMRNEIMTVMIRKMKDEMNWRPRWVLSEIRAPYTDAHIARFERVLNELEVRYS